MYPWYTWLSKRTHGPPGGTHWVTRPGEGMKFASGSSALMRNSMACPCTRTSSWVMGSPSPGLVTQWVPPGGPWVRFDSHVYQGYMVPPFYDSLLGKLIVWGRDREECLARSRWALEQFLVDG